MMKVLAKLWKVIDHNRYVAAFAVVYLVFLLWVVGCSPHTRSIVDGRPVDAVQFEQEVAAMEATLQGRIAAAKASVEAVNAEVIAFNEKAGLGRDDLQQKAEFRVKVVETIGSEVVKAASGDINPVNTILSLLTLGSIGAALSTRRDNARKDKRIETLKTESKA